MSYTVKYNRATNHIAGIDAKCTSEGDEHGGVVQAYAENACGVLTRGNLVTGKRYDRLEDALAAARSTGKKLCKNCEKAALAAIETQKPVADTSDPIQESGRVHIEGAEHQIGDEVYFIPSRSRKYPAYIPAGKVVVKRVIDHEAPTAWAPRFTYVVQILGVPEATQGTDATEMHAPGTVPEDYRFWETYTNAVCQDGDCREIVSYANSKIVREPVIRPKGQPVYPGMITSVERRVCAHH